MAWTTPRTWVAGEVVTAALLNTHLRDNLLAIGDSWSSYAVSWTAVTTNPSIGNGTLSGKYLQIGKLVIGSIDLAPGSTTTYGTGQWRFSIPITAADASMAVGSIRLFDTSGSSNQSGVFWQVSTTTVGPLTPSGQVSATFPFTWADGDRLAGTFIYQAA